MSGTEKEKKISFTLQRTRNKAYFFIHPSVTSVLPFYCSSYFPLRSSFCSHSFQFPSCSCVVAEHAKPRIKLKLYGHDMVEGCILDSLTTFQYTDRRGGERSRRRKRCLLLRNRGKRLFFPRATCVVLF